MKNSRTRLFRDHKVRHPVDNAYLTPKDVYPEEAQKILVRLNSFNSAEQLKSTIERSAKQKILSIWDAQNIINSKLDLGQFQDLRQVAVVLRIGAKKFDMIVRALSSQASV